MKRLSKMDAAIKGPLQRGQGNAEMSIIRGLFMERMFALERNLS